MNVYIQSDIHWASSQGSCGWPHWPCGQATPKPGVTVSHPPQETPYACPLGPGPPPHQGSHSSPLCPLPSSQELDPSVSPSLPANPVSFISNTCIYSVVIYWAHTDAWSCNRHFRKESTQQGVPVFRKKMEIKKKKFLLSDYSTGHCLISYQKREFWRKIVAWIHGAWAKGAWPGVGGPFSRGLLRGGDVGPEIWVMGEGQGWGLGLFGAQLPRLEISPAPQGTERWRWGWTRWGGDCGT